MWEDQARSFILQRNVQESLAYFPIYNAFRAIERKNRALKKKHIEIRNSIGVLQYEIQESIYQKNSNLEEVKQKLSSIAEDLSPRTKKDFDDIKVRFELSRKIREQEFLIQDLKSESETAKSQLSKSLEDLVRLQEEIQRKDAVNQTLVHELEGTRACLTSAEARLRTVEAENIQFAQRIVDEKNRSAQQLNEMNKMISPVSVVPDLLGESFNLMKKFGTGALFARPTEKPQLQVHENEIEDDFVDVKTSGIKKGVIDSSNSNEELFYNDDCLPPRKPLFYVKCHASEVNDIVYNKSFVMTGGSDSTVKIFEKNGSGQSVELSVGEYDELPPQDARNTLLVGGPVISLDLKGDWLAAGCCDRIGRIWSVRTGRLRHNLSGHSNKVNSIRLVGSGEERAVTGSADRIIRFWDISRSQPQIVTNLKVNSCVDCVSVSTDGNTVASGHQDGGLRLWNMQTKDKIHSIQKLHTTHITCTQFDPKRNHQILTASRDNTMTLLDARTYEPLMILRTPGFSLTSDWSQVTFSPDSSYIAAGGSDGSLYLWNAISGDFIQSIRGHKVGIMSVYWGESGVVSCDRQGGIIHWG